MQTPCFAALLVDEEWGGGGGGSSVLAGIPKATILPFRDTPRGRWWAKFPALSCTVGRGTMGFGLTAEPSRDDDRLTLAPMTICCANPWVREYLPWRAAELMMPD